MKEYRIGEFARYLGVTPDLLKHYEEQGIIRPVRSSKGYRYYPFTTAMLMIECVRLRNYGMTLREIGDILVAHNVSNEAVHARLQKNSVHLKEEIALDEALVENYRSFLSWAAPLKDRESDWEIRWSIPMLFLPHTDLYDFLQDPRVYAILKDWMSYIPIVRSTMKSDCSGHIVWGLTIAEEMARKLCLPVNDIVERVPPRKIFYYKFRGTLLNSQQEAVDSASHPVFCQLRSLNLKPAGGYFRVTLMPADWTQDIMYQYGYYAVPLAGEDAGCDERAGRR